MKKIKIFFQKCESLAFFAGGYKWKGNYGLLPFINWDGKEVNPYGTIFFL